MATLTLVNYKVKFYSESPFTPGEFEEMTPEEFNDVVVAHRAQFDRTYDGPNVQIFTHLYSNLHIKRVVTSEICTREVNID